MYQAWECIVKPFIVLSLLFLGFAFSHECNGADKPSKELHGTINIVLANKNGIVVVTDSALSFNEHIVSYGQKIFQVDGQTLSTIAGFYFAGGPTVDGVNYPARMLLPTLIQWVLKSNVSLPDSSLSAKLISLSSTVAFSLGATGEIGIVSGQTPSQQPSEITMAGLDQAILRIGFLRLEPKSDGHHFWYEKGDLKLQEVNNDFIYQVAGRGMWLNGYSRIRSRTDHRTRLWSILLKASERAKLNHFRWMTLNRLRSSWHF
jgi:hypothetical protein